MENVVLNDAIERIRDEKQSFLKRLKGLMCSEQWHQQWYKNWPRTWDKTWNRS